MEKRGITFWQTVFAVVVGLEIFQSLNKYQSELEAFPWWMLTVAFIVGAVIWAFLSEWWDNRSFKKEMLKTYGPEGMTAWMAKNSAPDVREGWIRSYEKDQRSWWRRLKRFIASLF